MESPVAADAPALPAHQTYIVIDVEVDEPPSQPVEEDNPGKQPPNQHLRDLTDFVTNAASEIVEVSDDEEHDDIDSLDVKDGAEVLKRMFSEMKSTLSSTVRRSCVYTAGQQPLVRLSCPHAAERTQREV
jgi:hypothetical protein